jgi:16S rRNA processing protein RimM
LQRKGAVSADLVCLAEVVGVHGVKGMLKLRIFSDSPENLPEYAPLCDAAGERSFALLSLHPHQNTWLAQIEGVDDRTQAEKLRGLKLCVPRERLPSLKDEDSYYHADLVGMEAVGEDGAALGRIVNVANFGAGDLLEIKPLTGASFYVPFTKAIVPSVDLAKRQATVIVPPGLLD